mmetsp:Transcript_6695/g.13489  ORF Transcript_6695/g.13489 Transcript_6695/m.13489 type:complete len:338 (+) Transcript_6695:158-1171(+)|eukprot:CAMPEP_0171519332 /NCGR_PEP_ID=MMETSP0959-20130129/5826_1 /TAXON_ID=87120 /ORGANISM="Aurantiochytrium limacinum, Strain ATCCMYA-1381" /LENGTH=337 /DNA_ID=CAMNT_0012058727 /DNA_START=160 /DNA_END=1173 /DNA_ORIENTATION=-
MELDAAFMAAAQRAGGVEPLLKGFFEFLHRRTDFYCVIPNDVREAKMGFRQGVAENMVLKTFRSLPYKNLDGTLRSPQEDQTANVPSSVHEKGQGLAPTKETETKKHPPVVQQPLSRTAKPQTSSSGNKISSNSPSAETAKQKTSQAPQVAETNGELQDLVNRIRLNDKGKQIPFAGNGGVTDRYHWSQTLEELTIHLNIPQGTEAKQIECSLQASKLRVALKTSGQVLLEGAYPNPERVKPDECFWSVERGTSTLVISLAKTRETWWDSILQGEPEIDTTQVDSTKNIDEYDESTQAAIRKVMFDQRQKAQGLPTSDELSKQSLLEKARDLPGSPF